MVKKGHIVRTSPLNLGLQNYLEVMTLIKTIHLRSKYLLVTQLLKTILSQLTQQRDHTPPLIAPKVVASAPAPIS